MTYLCAVKRFDAANISLYLIKYKKMTTTAPSTTTTRFRHIDADDVIYVGTAEITEDTADFGEPTTDVAILECWRYDTTVEEVSPYSKTFPTQLRKNIIQAAFEQRMTPPAIPVELPTDWDEIKILDAETTYLIEIRAILHEVKTDGDAAIFGLRSVSRVTSINGGKRYRITAKGGIDDVRRELHRIRIF